MTHGSVRAHSSGARSSRGGAFSIDDVPDERETTTEAERRAATIRFWSESAAPLRLPPVATPLVKRSALVLEALRYRPSGAMLAAATTSLPESIGAARNWDYRYCWPRDSSMSCASLARLGRFAPGLALLDWLCERVDHATRPDLLRPLYRVTGDEPVPEGTIAELAGYAGSRPVRIGNAAENQVQLDALGPVADLVHLVFTNGGGITSRHWSLLERIADVVVEHWSEPDHGIWEVRLARAHNVVSKVMCWQVLDRAVRIAAASGREVPDAWTRERDAIRRGELAGLEGGRRGVGHGPAIIREPPGVRIPDPRRAVVRRRWRSLARGRTPR